MSFSKKKYTEEEAKLKMADLCSRSEQCAYDVKQKLYRIGVMGTAANKIITFLEDNRFLDEERFARSYAVDKCRYSSWGPFKVRQGLFMKRISKDAINEAIDFIEEEEWIEAARKSAKGKCRTLDLTGENRRENRVKLYRFMMGRGFDSDISKQMVKESVSEQIKTKQNK